MSHELNGSPENWIEAFRNEQVFIVHTKGEVDSKMNYSLAHANRVVAASEVKTAGDLLANKKELLTAVSQAIEKQLTEAQLMQIKKLLAQEIAEEVTAKVYGDLTEKLRAELMCELKK